MNYSNIARTTTLQISSKYLQDMSSVLTDSRRSPQSRRILANKLCTSKTESKKNFQVCTESKQFAQRQSRNPEDRGSAFEKGGNGTLKGKLNMNLTH
jgi:hypothetical protein